MDLAEQVPSFRTHLQEIFALWQKAIADIIRDGQAEFKPDIDPDLIAEAIITSFESAMLMGKLYRTPVRIRRGFDLVRDIFNRAVK